MRYELPPDKRALTNDDLISDLRKCAAEIAPPPLTKERNDAAG